MKILCLSTITMAALAGCADMSGLGGTKHFACKAPVGVHCESLSATYHHSLGNNLPAQRSGTGPSSKAVVERNILAPVNLPVSAPAIGLAPAPLRTPVREMRIWIKAWQDDEQDLVDQSYVYLVVDKGNWRVAHVQQHERDTFARLTPPQPVPVADISPSIQASQTMPSTSTSFAPIEEPVDPAGK